MESVLLAVGKFAAEHLGDIAHLLNAILQSPDRKRAIRRATEAIAAKQSYRR